MSARSLYRQYRPHRFSDVIGQEQIVQTLLNAVSFDRLSHAYLFSGPRGTGKTSIARILAMLVNCQSPQSGDPCLKCSSCTGILNASTMDLIEFDAASRGKVDEIREIIDRIAYAASELKYKVYIMDEAHMLTRNAFDALLKTLEEPPDRTLIILCTTEPHRIPVTIRSRCQRFDFSAVSNALVAGHLEAIAGHENAELAPDAARLLAQLGEGSVRDAIGLLERALASCNDRVSLDDVERLLGLSDRRSVMAAAGALAGGDRKSLLSMTSAVAASGKSLEHFLRDLTALFHEALLYGIDGDLLLDKAMTEEDQALLLEISKAFSEAHIIRIVRELAATMPSLKGSSQGLIVLQAALLGLLSTGASVEPSSAPPPADKPAVIRRGAQPEGQPVVRASIASAAQPAGAAISEAAVPAYGDDPGLPPDGSPVTSDNELSDINDTAGMKRAWPSVVRSLKSIGVHLYAVISCSEVLHFDGERVELGFQYQYNLDTAAKPENRKSLETLLDRLVKPGISVEMTLISEKLPLEEEKNDGISTGPEMVYAALDLFDGSRVVGK